MNKLRKLLTVVLVGIFGLVFTTLSIAESKGNPRKGRYLFRQNCRECHAKLTTTKAGVKSIQPSGRTQEEWQKTFEGEAYKSVKCIKNWDKLSSEDINDIYLFLFEHASDSPAPLTCSDN